VYAIELSVDYPRKKFRLQSVDTDSPEGWEVVKQAEGKGLTLSFAGTKAHPGGRIASVIFKQREEGYRAEIQAQGRVNERSLQGVGPVRIGKKPEQVLLEGNAPNPAAEQTTMSYVLPERQHVRLAVYGMLGREVSVLVKGTQRAGRHKVHWQFQGNGGKRVGSGTYFYRLRTNEETHTKKMVITK
jgi:hypothetical protein